MKPAHDLASGSERRVTLYIASSLDGYIARRDGSIDWLPQPEAGGEDYGFAAFDAQNDTVLMGRKTYEMVRSLEGEHPFPGKRCIVFSHRRAGTRDRRARFTDEDPADCVRRLRAKRGKGIWLVGGGEIARDCFEAGVVNEIVLTLVPVLLGEGLPLFLPRAGTTWLRLCDTRTYPNGLVQLRYVTGAPRPREIDAEERAAAWAETASTTEAVQDGGAVAKVFARDDPAHAATFAVGAHMVRAWAMRSAAA